MSTEYTTVETPVIGNRYHISWANKNCNWKLVDFDLETGLCNLIAPATQKPMKNIKISDLRNVRKNEKS